MGSWIFRTDASVPIGAGHFMRCLALAQAGQAAGQTSIFAMAGEATRLQASLKSEGMEVFRLSTPPGSSEDAGETADLARRRKAGWIIVDGYHFDALYQRRLKESGVRLLFIDDYAHCKHYPADVILNQNPHSHSIMYNARESNTRLLLGTHYALLRREFLKWIGWRREFPETAGNILVTLGGSDPENVTLKVIHALQSMDIRHMEVKVLVGPSNPHFSILRSASQHPAISLVENVTNMPGLMAWADVAVCAGGGTCWELGFMGVPSVILVLAENQEVSARFLSKQGVFLNLGSGSRAKAQDLTLTLRVLMLDLSLRKELSQKGRSMIDGLGACRVTDALGAH